MNKFFFFFNVIIGSDDHIIAMSALRKDWDPLLGEIYRKEKKRKKLCFILVIIALSCSSN